MNNTALSLQPEHLTGELEILFASLAETLGRDAALAAVQVLLDNYGGSNLYIPKRDTVERESRNAAIKAMFKTNGIRAIAQHFNLADNTVRDIVFDRNTRIPQAELNFDNQT